jgi:hypothetical protein
LLSGDHEKGMEDSQRRGRTPRDFQVNGNFFTESPPTGEIFAKRTAGKGARTHSNHPFRGGHGLVGFEKGRNHMLCEGTGDQKNVRMTGGRGDEKAQAMDVIIGIVKLFDLV